MTLLQRVQWGTAYPIIYLKIYYESQRSGSSMQYKIKIAIEPMDSGQYFGYPINQTITLDGTQLAASTIKKRIAIFVVKRHRLRDRLANRVQQNSRDNLTVCQSLCLLRKHPDRHIHISPGACPAASVLNAVPSFDVDGSIQISITTYNSAFVDNLIIKYGAAVVKTVNNITAGNISFTSAEKATIYGLMSTVKSGTFTFTLTTRDGTTVLGTSTKTATGSITNATPTLSATVVDTNSTTIALTGSNAKLVKGKSTALITITSAGLKGATISSKIVNGTAVAGTTLSIPNVSTSPFTVTVTDSRGNTVTVVLNPVVIAYIPLTISANFYRPAPTTGEVEAVFSGNYFNGSFGAVANTLAVWVKYRLKGAVDWISIGSFIQGTEYTITGNTFASIAVSLGSIFDYTANYEFAIYYMDKLTNTYTVLQVGKGLPVFDWGEDDFNINGQPKVKSVDQPYLVAEGDSGIWHYIKKSNGYCECFGAIIITGASTSAWGSIHSYDYSTAINFPYAFTEIAYIGAMTKGGAGLNAGSIATLIHTLSAITQIGVSRGTAVTNGNFFYLSACCWKNGNRGWKTRYQKKY